MSIPLVATVLIVDDHPVVRDGLKAMLSAEPDIDVVGEAGSGSEALSAIRQLRPSVVVIDLLLPDIVGSEVIRRVCEGSSDSSFIVLTSVAGDEEIYRAIEAGARDIFSKTWPERNWCRRFARCIRVSAT